MRQFATSKRSSHSHPNLPSRNACRRAQLLLSHKRRIRFLLRRVQWTLDCDWTSQCSACTASPDVVLLEIAPPAKPHRPMFPSTLTFVALETSVLFAELSFSVPVIRSLRMKSTRPWPGYDKRIVPDSTILPSSATVILDLRTPGL